MANSFKSQSLFDKATYFAFKEAPGICDKIDWQSDKFEAVYNPGKTRYIRRPQYAVANVEDYGTDRSVQGTWMASAAIKPYQEVEVPLTLTDYVYYPLEMSIEEMTNYVDQDDVMDRALRPAAVAIADQIQTLAARTVEFSVGNTIYSGTPSAGAPESNWDRLIATNNSLWKSRGVPYVNANEKSMLVQASYTPGIISSQVTKYHAQNAGKAYDTGALTDWAGFNVYDTGIFGTRTITPPTSGVTFGAAFSASGPWTTYSTVPLAFTGTLQKGTRFSVAVSGVTVNGVYPTTKTDNGYAATYVVREDVVGAGTSVNVPVSDCIITSGDSKNVSVSVIPSGATVNIINGGVTRANLAFHNRAIVGAAPKLKIPSGVKARQINVGGLNIAILEDHQFMSLQSVAVAVAIVGFTVVRPEACSVTYLGAA